MLSVRAMRVNANLTQKQVAKELGLTEVTYRLKEHGERDFKFSEIIKLCKLFGVKISDFVEE